MSELLDDPWTSAQIEAAVAPYAKTLTRDQLQFLREQLRDMLATDDEAARLLRAAHPRDVDQSGEVGCAAPEPTPEVGPAAGHGTGDDKREKAG